MLGWVDEKVAENWVGFAVQFFESTSTRALDECVRVVLTTD